MKSSYRPQPEQARILDRAWEFVSSVPYQVSARWLFYNLLQDGTYNDKGLYKSHFLPLLAKARKSFYKEWRPWTLADDTREPVIRGTGWTDEQHWLDELGEEECRIDKWHYQENYVEVWFEAKAMRGQFEYYTQYITLRPFGGDPSIPFKWDIAWALKNAADLYEHPIKILYFGDLDKKGLDIPKDAARQIREWCNVEFELIRCGLNPGDEIKYEIMENPEKPGTYQWEALSKTAAEILITQSVNQFVNQDSFSAIEKLEADATAKFRSKWIEVFGDQGRA